MIVGECLCPCFARWEECPAFFSAPCPFPRPTLQLRAGGTGPPRQQGKDRGLPQSLATLGSCIGVSAMIKLHYESKGSLPYCSHGQKPNSQALLSWLPDPYLCHLLLC